MRRGVNLHRRTEEREVADADAAHVKDNAVEIEEHALAEEDVRPVIAEERRLHPDGVATVTEQFHQDAATLFGVFFVGGVQFLAEVAGKFPRRGERRVERVVQFPRQHLLTFATHGTPSQS